MTLTYTVGGVAMTGSTHFVDQDSVTGTDALGQRNTYTFRVISRDGSYRPVEGAAVSVSDGTITRFGGNIRQLSVTQKGAALVSEIGCASWESLFDRRPTGQRSYTNQTAGYIFEDLLTNCMGSEGLSASVVTTGPVIPSFECDFASVREAYDTLCALASNDTDTYMWDCSTSMVARFYRSDSFHAPFDITSTSTDVLYVGGGARIGAAWSLDKYTNRLFVRMGKLIRPAETQSFTVGTATTFTLDFPVALVPTITLDSAAQTVGILDVDTGKDWYWQENSPNITRGTGTGGTTLAVLYQGYESIVLGPFENAVEVAARAAAEGNLGYYVTVLDSGIPGTAADAATRAQAWLDKYSQIPCTVTYPTQRDDLRAGMWQDIYWPEIGVDIRCLLESVTMTQVNGYYLWTAKAISGALTGDYKMRLRELRGAGANASGTPGAPGAPGDPGSPGTAVTPPLLPTSVTASDHPSERVTDENRVVSTPIYVDSVTLPSGHGAEWLHVWLANGGITEDLGTFNIGDTIKFWRRVPAAAITGNTVFVTTGKTGAENPLSTAFESAVFSIGGYTVPAANNGITATVGAFEYRQDGPDGATYGYIAPWPYTDPVGVNLDFFVRVTVQNIDGAGSAVGAEGAYGGTQITGPGDAHLANTNALLITLAGQAGVRFRIYVANRVSQGNEDFTDTATNTLQGVAWNGGAVVDHRDVMFGALPAGALDMRRANPSSLGANLKRDPVSGKLTATQSPNLIANPFNGSLADGTDGWNATIGAIGIDSLGRMGWSGDAYIVESARHTCTAGEAFVASAYVQCDAGNPGSLTWYMVFEDAAGGTVAAPSSTTVAPAGVLTTISYTTPAGAVSVHLNFYSYGNPGGGWNWYIINIRLVGQVSTGQGTEPDGKGGVRIPTGGVYGALIAAAAVSATKTSLAAINAATGAVNANHIVDAMVTSAGGGGGIGIAKLNPGTNIFTGEVYLSRGSGYPVIALRYDGVTLFGQADGAGTGLTNKPYVRIQSTGVLVHSGGNPSVSIDATLGVTVWSVNGNTTFPYVRVSSDGVDVVGGSLTLTSGNVTVTISKTIIAGVLGIRLVDTGANLALDLCTGGLKAYRINNPGIFTWVLPNAIMLSDGTNYKTINSYP